MKGSTVKENSQKTMVPGFDFLPADTYTNNIEIYPPFAKLANIYFANRGLEISSLESGSINISFKEIDNEKKQLLLNEIRVFLKKSRKHVIQNFLIYKDTGITYL